jgi:arsenate reductase-like glutaredoxin family protein
LGEGFLPVPLISSAAGRRVTEAECSHPKESIWQKKLSSIATSVEAPAIKRWSIYRKKVSRLPKKNVSRDQSAVQDLMKMKARSLPVIVIGDKLLHGFNPKAIDEALAS